jgi:hypothetical protein
MTWKTLQRGWISIVEGAMGIAEWKKRLDIYD